MARRASNAPNKFTIVHWNDNSKDIDCEILTHGDNSFEWVGVPPEFLVMMDLKFNAEFQREYPEFVLKAVVQDAVEQIIGFRAPSDLEGLLDLTFDIKLVNPESEYRI